MATKFSRRVPLEVENYTYENLRLLARSLAREPRRRHGRSRSAALPAVGDLLHARRSSKPATGSWRKGSSAPTGSASRRSRSAEGDRVPGRLDRADHLQHLPAATSRALLRAGLACATSASIVRVPLASGLLTGKFDRESSFAPDDHQDASTASGELRCGRDVRRRRLRARPRGRRGVAERSCRRARRWRNSRCVGSSATRRSRRSFPARRRRSEHARERGGSRPAALPEETLQHDRQGSTASGSRRQVHHRW